MAEDKTAVDAQLRFYGAIHDDFNRDPVQAALRYRVIWSESLASGDGPYSSESVLLTIAGLLVMHDPDNYENYYDYIIGGINSGDYENKIFAISLLGNVHGKESLDMIFNVLADDRATGMMLRSAINAVELRAFSAARYNPDEYGYIMDGLSVICADPQSSMVRDFCARRASMQTK